MSDLEEAISLYWSLHNQRLINVKDTNQTLITVDEITIAKLLYWIDNTKTADEYAIMAYGDSVALDQPEHTYNMI